MKDEVRCADWRAVSLLIQFFGRFRNVVPFLRIFYYSGFVFFPSSFRLHPSSL